MKKIIFYYLLFLISFSALLTGLKGMTATANHNSIADNIIRLHVIADSDSDRDQYIKYQVRDAIIGSLRDRLATVKNIQDARHIIVNDEDEIKRITENTLKKYNCNKNVSVSLKERYFPVKQYGDLTFPAGLYQALCVELGSAQGRNWWCVLFPSLCFVDETTATVPEDSKEKLKENLSTKDYEMLEKDSTIYSRLFSDDNYSENINESDKLHVESGIAKWFMDIKQ